MGFGSLTLVLLSQSLLRLDQASSSINLETFDLHLYNYNIDTLFTIYCDRYLQSCDKSALVNLDQILLRNLLDLGDACEPHGQPDLV